MAPITDKQLVDYLIPALLTVAVALLGWLAVSVAGLDGSMKVAVVRIDDHERRLDNLEVLYFRTTRGGSP